MLTALAVGLGLWQALARRAQLPSPVDQLLLEFLAPSIRAAGSLRNRLTPGPHYDVTPNTAAGLARMRALEAENTRLRALLALRDTAPVSAATAEIIGRSNSPWQGYLLIGSGAAEGVAPHMVVLTPDGVLGQVATVGRQTAKVIPLTDRESGIGAMVERSHVKGVLKGSGEATCQLQYLAGDADVRIGDQVLTSGLVQIFPRGLPLGRVTAVTHDATLSTRTATVIPAANPETAEMVVVLQLPAGN